MVVWLSCYAFIPAIFLIAYDKLNKLFSKCCKKKTKVEDKNNLNKEEIDKIKNESVDKRTEVKDKTE